MADIIKLQTIAKSIRRDVLEMTYQSGANGGHIGGAFSAAEILAVLYGHTMNVHSSMPQEPLRDRFILSKGHVALAHYAALAETGFISREEMMSFEVSGSEFPTHEVMNPEKGIEFSSGSLGYGASLGVGNALMAKKNKQSYRVYVLMGDGECNEGSVWEAIISAAKFKLDNLTIIIDVNGQQLDGYTADIMPVHDFGMVFKGFGCNVIEIDGNDIQQIISAMEHVVMGQPTIVIANTIKGKGVPSLEGRTGIHHMALTEELYKIYMREMED